MNPTAKVTIVIPSFNHASYLKHRLDSIINQTYRNFDIIIIDDCSSDESLPILEEFASVHSDLIKYFIVNSKNSGSGYQSWKKGIELAESPYIWIAETDDLAEPDFLTNGMAVLTQNSNCQFVFCASKVVDEKGNQTGDTRQRTKILGVKKDEYGIFGMEVFLKNMPFKTLVTNGSSVIFKKPEIGFCDTFFNYKQMSDAYIWTYLLQNGDFAFLNKLNNSFRRHPDSTTIRMYNKHRKTIYVEKALYIIHFQLKEKRIELVKSYVRDYLWYHKRHIFNFDLINLFDSSFIGKVTYMSMAIRIFGSKSIKRILSKARG